MLFGFRKLTAILAMLLLSAIAQPLNAQTSDAQQAITQVLVDSANGWNRGEIDRYLNAYSTLPEMTIISGKAVVHGIDQWRQTVTPLFLPENAASRGIRTFEVVSFVPIDADNAMIIVINKNSASPTQQTLASYLFRRGPFGWRMLIGHAS